MQALRRDVEALKIAFYRLRRAEVEAARRRFIEEGAPRRSSRPPWTAPRCSSRSCSGSTAAAATSSSPGWRPRREKNLATKLGIIEELKELVDSDETLNHTFTKFRELQQRWKETGIVPQQHVKDLWETYNLHVENFYNFIKINKELRDLDLKKNYEQKLALCEQAEALVLEPSVVEAFHKLQKLHDEWRETGPVANEYKGGAVGAVQGRFEPHQQAASGAFRGAEGRAGQEPRAEDRAVRSHGGAGRAAFHRAQGVEPGERPAARDTEDMEDDRVRPEKG